MDFGSDTMDFGSGTMDFGSDTMDFGSDTMDFGSNTINTSNNLAPNSPLQLNALDTMDFGSSMINISNNLLSNSPLQLNALDTMDFGSSMINISNNLPPNSPLQSSLSMQEQNQVQSGSLNFIPYPYTPPYTPYIPYYTPYIPSSDIGFDRAFAARGLNHPGSSSVNDGFGVSEGLHKNNYHSAPPCHTVGAMQQMPDLPVVDFNLFDDLFTRNWAGNDLFPQPNVLQQYPQQHLQQRSFSPSPYPTRVYANVQARQQQCGQEPPFPTLPHGQQPLPPFCPSLSPVGAVDASSTTSSLSMTQGARQQQQQQQQTQTPHPAPRKRGRGRPCREEQHRALAIRTGNVSSSGELAFHTMVGPAPNNQYQSSSFRRRDRKKVAQRD